MVLKRNDDESRSPRVCEIVLLCRLPLCACGDGENISISIFFLSVSHSKGHVDFFGLYCFCVFPEG